MEIQLIQNKIYEVRGQRIMLDFDLAELYEVETKSLNLAVKRNIKRFPIDFMFQLTKKEWNVLRLQIETSNGRGGKRYLPHAFTEQGLAMLSGILKSNKAINVNIFIMRAFVQLRQFALTNKDIANRLTELEDKFTDISQAIKYLLQKDQQEVDQKKRPKIGFKNK